MRGTFSCGSSGVAGVQELQNVGLVLAFFSMNESVAFSGQFNPVRGQQSQVLTKRFGMQVKYGIARGGAD
jgi:hypothetical protein